MPFQSIDGVRYYTFDTLQLHGVVHAIFTRIGGVSPTPWKSLNVGGTVGDAADRVKENRLRSLQALGRDHSSVFEVWQVHSAEVVNVNHPRDINQPHLKADALASNRAGITLYMRFADCVPVLLFDPIKRVIGIAHAGWQGTVKRTAAALVDRFKQDFACQPEDILACIGPSIGPDHYEIGPDVIQQIRSAFGERSDELLSSSNGDFPGSKVKFDLWKANRMVLEQVGVRQIEVSGICTACHTHDWFSHRAEAGRTGRFGALIGL
ncbi:MAG TPA: peptidoglycan editing factor PgeF [Anaerolineales bacterium]|nr:peptidoglycan editing factor PgeF [Anaerolineales bacterium]